MTRRSFGISMAYERIKILLNTDLRHDGCWEWLGARNHLGYGRHCGNQAHRLSYTAFVGPIRKGLVVHHKCRHPECVNPDHLSAVTKAEDRRAITPGDKFLGVFRKLPKKTLYKRFWEKVVVYNPEDCWIWIGARINGHGTIWFGHRNYPAYRLSYEMFNGMVSYAECFDHICRAPECVNPDHIRPATNRQNSQNSLSASGVNYQKARCIRGHWFDEKNTRYRPTGGRSCRECANAASAAKRLLTAGPR